MKVTDLILALLPIIIMISVIFLLIFRRGRRQEEEHKEILDADKDPMLKNFYRLHVITGILGLVWLAVFAPASFVYLAEFLHWPAGSESQYDILHNYEMGPLKIFVLFLLYFLPLNLSMFGLMGGLLCSHYIRNSPLTRKDVYHDAYNLQRLIIRYTFPSSVRTEAIVQARKDERRAMLAASTLWAIICLIFMLFSKKVNGITNFMTYPLFGSLSLPSIIFVVLGTWILMTGKRQG